MVLNFSVLLVMVIAVSGCGAGGASRSSRLQDEVDPVGSHDHYLGKFVVRGPGSRKFPSANEANISVAFVTTNGSGESTVSTRDVADFGQLEIPVVSKMGETVEIEFENNHGRFYPLPNFEPSAQDFVRELRLRRIDVNKMLVTRQDGTTYRASGTYTVYPVCSYCPAIVAGAATETGVDVPAGDRYKVTVRARSEEGSILTDVHTLDFRD